MSLKSTTESICGQLLILGCGTSVGVPMLGCNCQVCSSDNPKNNRTRCSVVLGLPEGNLLVDTTPELRIQLLREKIGLIHSVFFTHSHADHLFGLDDLRLFQFYLGGPVPLYCDEQTEARIRTSYDYCFLPPVSSHSGSTPKLTIDRIQADQPIELLGAEILPLYLDHGTMPVLGFRVGNVAYCTDVKTIPPQTMEKLQGLDVLILNALRHEPHVTHLNLEEAIAVVKQLNPKRTIFTHMSHDLEYEATNAILPENMELAYDGMRFELS